MATLVNKLNREVKVIIPNMCEFSTFYSDKEGVLPMFFKKDWVPIKEEHWKPTQEQIELLEKLSNHGGHYDYQNLELKKLVTQLKKL